MAPDLNSFASGRASRTASASNANTMSPQQENSDQGRRVSSIMGPPPVPNNSSLPSSPRPPQAMMERSPSSQGQAHAPIRHPKPLTAAELHLELEKEQESIVNRLTRELSALRAQTASVASTTSSTSDLFTSSQILPDPYTSSYGTGTGASIIPTSARRHRSSSNLSTRSARSARETVARDRDAASTSVSGVAAPRDSDRSHQTSARQSLDIQRPETSRQNSYNLGLSTSTSSGNVGMYRSPSTAASPYAAPPGYNSYPHRSSISTSHSRDQSQQGQSQGLGIGASPGLETRSTSFGSAQAAARYEEAAVQRQELEAVKKENEALKQKIRDLERRLVGNATTETSAAITPTASTS